MSGNRTIFVPGAIGHADAFTAAAKAAIGWRRRPHVATNTIIKPWDWGDKWGFVPAVASTGTRVVHVAGQCDQSREDGSPLNVGNMAAQIAGAIDNLEAVLAAAGVRLSDVVRLNYYVTDIAAFNAVPHEAHIGRLEAAGCFPASTLLGVTGLAMPGMMVEIEATAVG